jgi:hypothetical protein
MKSVYETDEYLTIFPFRVRLPARIVSWTTEHGHEALKPVEKEEIETLYGAGNTLYFLAPEYLGSFTDRHGNDFDVFVTVTKDGQVTPRYVDKVPKGTRTYHCVPTEYTEKVLKAS